MKLLLISDIHANFPCLEAVLKAEADADVVLCAGDLVDVGFYPCEVVDCIRDLGIPCVVGNHDLNIVRMARSGEGDARNPANFAQLNAGLLQESHLTYLESLPETLQVEYDRIHYHIVHNYAGYELIPSDYAFDEFRGDTPAHHPHKTRAVFMGHTHHPALIFYSPDRVTLNPGSVGYNRPADPSIATRYMTVTDGHIRFHALEHPHCCGRRQLGQRFDQQFNRT